MPRSNIPPRNSPSTSNGSSDLLPFLDPAPTGSMNQTSGKAKVLNGSHVNSNGKRNSSSGSSDNSGSDEEGEDGDAESGADDDDDDEDEAPGKFAPSYSKKSIKAYKAGPASSPTASRKRMKYNDEGQASDGDNDSDGSDDSYEGVNDITDEDDEEQDVEMLEEQMIVQSERTRGPTNVSNANNDKVDYWSDFGAFDDQLLFSNTSFFDEDQYFSRYNQLDTQANGGVESEPETPTKRRVHFEERNDATDNDKTPTPSSDDDDDDEIPSDFLQQDCLDPDLRRMIENDVDVNLRNQNRSYEDDIYGHSYEQHTSNIYHVDTEPASDGSSGYETDDGETTDEDLPPPATITHPRTLLRRDSSVSLTPESDSSSRPSQPPRRRGPVLGTFVADPNKPVAVVDCTGQRLVIIPAYASSRHDWLASATASLSGTAENSPRATTMHVVDESESDALISPTRSNYSPMISSSANLMMTAVGNDTSTGGQVMGPPEAFYPSNNFGPSLDEDEDDEDDDGEDVLNVDDFIDFGNGSSDEEMDKDFEETDEPTSPVLASPVQPNTTPITARHDDSNQRTSAERFLDHLDQGVVTAFRRNHTRYQALIRLPQHREFMPANSPSRPASVFRNATDLKGSTRKRKASNYMGGEAVRRKLMDTHQRNNLSI